MFELRRKLLGFALHKEEEGADGNGRGGANSDGRGGISDGRGNKDPGGRDGAEGGAGGNGDPNGDPGNDPNDPGRALEEAEEQSATHSQAQYSDQTTPDLNADGSISIGEVFGLQTQKEVAGLMAGAGFGDQDISEALSNDGVGYRERAGLLGPLDAAVTGPISRAAVGAATGLAFAANPALGLASSVADSYQRGAILGDQSELGGKLGSIAGSRYGAMAGSAFGPYGALAGLALGGLGGKHLGAKIGSGQGVGPAAPDAEKGDGSNFNTGAGTSVASAPVPKRQEPSSVGDDFFSYVQRWGA